VKAESTHGYNLLARSQQHCCITTDDGDVDDDDDDDDVACSITFIAACKKNMHFERLYVQ
jgi:hypothetical protein